MAIEGLKRILYVEDEPDIRAVAQIALESVGGFVLKVCSTGDEAIEHAVAFEPDLVLLDVMMPGIDGPSTLAKLREIPALAETPAIFMTAKVQPQEIRHFKSLGAIDVIAKPFDPMTLSSHIEESWRQHNER